MTRDDPGSLLPPSNPEPRVSGGFPIRLIAFALIAVGGSLAGSALVGVRWSAAPTDPPAIQPAAAKPLDPFRNWPAAGPDLAIVLSGEDHAYLQPCGCSRPQLGGIERRYNFLKELKGKGWPLVALNLGDVAYRRGSSQAVQEQAVLKYATAMKALNLMGYAAVGVGQHETGMPLLDALAAFTLQQPDDATPRVVCANLLDADKNFPGADGTSMVRPFVVIPGINKAPTVAVTASVGPTVAEKIKDPTVRFGSNAVMLGPVLAQMANRNPDLYVLLYHGTPREAAALAGAFTKFDVILCLSPESEPAGEPLKAGDNKKTLIITVGHKGRYAGVLGAFRTGRPEKPFEFRYELVALGEEYETAPEAEDGHPVLTLLQDYAQQLKDQNFLGKYTQAPHPIQVTYPEQRPMYVGSDRCATCHAAEYLKWKESKHSHAYEALETIARKPTLRNFDGECVVCHVVGFGFQSGYTDSQRTPHLKGVGCESCHGPGSAHVGKPDDHRFLAALSPWKVKPTDRLPDKDVLLRADKMCQKCHDVDNDPHFKFEAYWVKIAHSRPQANSGKANDKTATPQPLK